MANRYDSGDLVRCTGVFTDSAGAVSDPGTLLFTWRTPTGTYGTYTYGVDAEVVKDGSGTYHVDLEPTVIGNWWYRWTATGTPTEVTEDHFAVTFQEM